MFDSIYSIFALVGGTVLGFQFVMLLLGLSHHGGDASSGHDLAADGYDGSLAGDATFEGDAAFGHDAGWEHGHTSSAHGDVHGDITHATTAWFYEMLSIRSLSAAALFFGLAGKTALAYGQSPQAAFVYAALAGALSLYGVYWLFKQAYRLQNSGNENIRRAVGLPATVYVPVPAARAGAGKVSFRLQDRTVEYLAVTNETDRLATGEKVVIVGIVNPQTVRVARVKQDAATADLA